MTALTGEEYARRYGPTVGDRVRLGDTDLTLAIEQSDVPHGDEVVVGWGKTFRAGIMFVDDGPGESELDAVITNVILVDPVLGVRKTNIGLKDGVIAGIGRAGNPDTGDGIDLVLGPGTVGISGENLIATPGGVDTHVHLRTSRLMPAALSSGITTLVTGGTLQNPAFNLYRAFESLENVPLNIGMLGRAAGRRSMERQVLSGACGIKIHEDFGGYPRTIDDAISTATEFDVAVAMHTDGLNEAGSFEDTLEALGGRVVHAYHVEGSGGGHPDVIRMAGEASVISSSTTPTIPFGRNATRELRAMLWASHGMNHVVPGHHELVNERVRENTIRAESYLHELGAIPIINSDSQGMGRIGEVIRRTWQLADQMKRVTGDTSATDNARILRYMAKYTINAARVHGIADAVGSLEPGKVADVVLWRPAFFGVKPEMVIKGGYGVWGVTGDGNATVTKTEPTYYGPLVGGEGLAPSSLSTSFVSRASLPGFSRAVRTARKVRPVAGCRNVSKVDMLYNASSPSIEVDPLSGEVFVEGSQLPSFEVGELPLNRRYLIL